MEIFHDQKIKDTYKIGRTLGEGGYAKVKLCKKKDTGDQYALKVIQRGKLNQQDKDNLEREIEILGSVQHENVVRTFCAYVDPVSVYIVMEVMAGGELFDRIVQREKYTINEARVAMKDCLNGLVYLHDRGIVHRDLKPENLLYAKSDEDCGLKIADFGLASMLSEKELLSTACGTPGYVAPEILFKKGYGIEVDMWSIGVIFYILLSGCPPFDSEDNTILFQKIMKADYEFISPEFDDASDEAKDLVSKLMCLDPKSRLTAKQALEHPFMTSGDILEAKSMDMAKKNLKSLNAKRRFRKAIVAVQITHLLTTFKSQEKAKEAE